MSPYCDWVGLFFPSDAYEPKTANCGRNNASKIEDHCFNLCAAQCSNGLHCLSSPLPSLQKKCFCKNKNRTLLLQVGVCHSALILLPQVLDDLDAQSVVLIVLHSLHTQPPQVYGSCWFLLGCLWIEPPFSY